MYHSFPLHFPSFFNQRLRSLLVACCLLVAHHVGPLFQDASRARRVPASAVGSFSSPGRRSGLDPPATDAPSALSEPLGDSVQNEPSAYRSRNLSHRW